MSREIEIDDKWLHDRGGLHDSTITGFEGAGDEIWISIKDEWWNSEGYPDYEGPSPGKIIVRGCRAKPESFTLTSTWIMDSVLERAPLRLCIDLNDGSKIVLEASSFWWRPDTSSP